MKYQRFQISVILFTIILVGCISPPDFSPIPQIGFKSVVFNDSLNSRSTALIIEFDFEDGDGNIGLTDEDVIFPYHPFFYIIDANGSLVTYSDPAIVPPLFTTDLVGNEALFSDTDNRPVFNCTQYQVLDADTLYIEKNEFHFNFHIAFDKKINGEYAELNPSNASGSSCSDSFDGRIGVFDESSIGKPLTGTISYTIQSAGFVQNFGNDTIRMRFYVYDKDLNKSNIVESPDFTLPLITKEVD